MYSKYLTIKKNWFFLIIERVIFCTVTKGKRISDKFLSLKPLVHPTLEEIQQSKIWWITAKVLDQVLGYLYW